MLKGHTYQLAATVSFAYNAGDWKGACRAINEAGSAGRSGMEGGRVLPDLVKRRAEERALFERGL